MPRQYISDVITNDEIAKWQNGNRILIYSQTGSGKSFFICLTIVLFCFHRILSSHRMIFVPEYHLKKPAQEVF